MESHPSGTGELGRLAAPGIMSADQSEPVHEPTDRGAEGTHVVIGDEHLIQGDGVLFGALEIPLQPIHIMTLTVKLHTLSK